MYYDIIENVQQEVVHNYYDIIINVYTYSKLEID